MIQLLKAIWQTLFGPDGRSRCRYCDNRCEAHPCTDSPNRERAFEAEELSRISSRPIPEATLAQLRAAWDAVGKLEDVDEVARYKDR